MIGYCWSVEGMGLGFDVDELINKRKLNSRKILELSGVLIDEDLTEYGLDYELQSLNLEDVVRNIINGVAKEEYRDLLTPAFSGEFQDGFFLLYPRSHPWEMSDFEKSLSREDIEGELSRILGEIIKQ